MRGLRDEIVLRTALTAGESAQKLDLTASKIYRETRKIGSNNRTLFYYLRAIMVNPLKSQNFNSRFEKQHDITVRRPLGPASAAADSGSYNPLFFKSDAKILFASSNVSLLPISSHWPVI